MKTREAYPLALAVLAEVYWLSAGFLLGDSGSDGLITLLQDE